MKHASGLQAVFLLCLFALGFAHPTLADATVSDAASQTTSEAASSETPAATGEVIFVAGQVSIERDGEAITPSLGAPISEGDRIDTGDDGYVHIRFADGGLISVRPRSRAIIDSYRFDADAPADSRVRIELTRGALRSVTGRAGESARDQFRVNTPVAAIGIRGTDFVVYADAEVSRLAVRSGGVVMAPFGARCIVASFNPCGEGAAELFASEESAALLQVRAGQMSALLITDAPDPDELIPPHPQESTLFNSLSRDDRGATTHTAPRKLPVANSYEEGLERIARFIDSDDLMQLASLLAVQGENGLLPRDRNLVAAPAFSWGRWDDGSYEANRVAAALHGESGTKERIIASNRMFHLLALQGGEAVQLPQRGQAAFDLNAYEAYVVRGDQAEVASISNASLVMDFDRSRFATRMDLHADSLAGVQPVVGTGSINIDGRTGYFENDRGSLAQIKGQLSDNASEAGMLFDYWIERGVYATGATHWINAGKPELR